MYPPMSLNVVFAASTTAYLALEQLVPVYSSFVANEILLQREVLRAALGACKDATPMDFRMTLKMAFGCE